MKVKLPLRTISVEGNMAVTSDFIKASSVICNIFVTNKKTYILFGNTIKSATNKGFVSWWVFMLMFLTEHRWQLSEKTTYKKFSTQISNIKW